MRTATDITSVSAVSTVGVTGLLCATGFAGDVSFVASGAGFPQPEAKNANTRQTQATWVLLKDKFAFMRFKGLQRE
jgi:hypothetical protein